MKGVFFFFLLFLFKANEETAFSFERGIVVSLQGAHGGRAHLGISPCRKNIRSFLFSERKVSHSDLVDVESHAADKRSFSQQKPI